MRSSKIPIGRLAPKKYKRKKPATVGGNTSGRVKRPSIHAFARLERSETTNLAAYSPRKKVNRIEMTDVFNDIQTGLKSIFSASKLFLLINGKTGFFENLQSIG